MSLDPDDILQRCGDILFAHWQTLLQQRSTTLERAEAERIHDLRVASRRFRSAIDTFGNAASKDARSYLKKNIRSLTRSLGDLRNLDEARSYFSDKLPKSDHLLAKLCRQFDAARRKELVHCLEQLERLDCRELDRSVRRVVANLTDSSDIKILSGISPAAYFQQHSDQLFRSVDDLIAISHMPERHDERHALRIAIKKRRYYLEIAAVVLDKNLDDEIARHKEYQTLLGKLNDLRVFAQLLDACSLSLREKKRLAALQTSDEQALFSQFVKLCTSSPLLPLTLI